MSRIKPILDKIIVKVDKSADENKSGIILAGKSKDKPVIAKVVEAGTGGMIDGREVKMYIQRGDKVVINKSSGVEINIDGEELIVLRQPDVLAVVVS